MKKLQSVVSAAANRSAKAKSSSSRTVAAATGKATASRRASKPTLRRPSLRRPSAKAERPPVAATRQRPSQPKVAAAPAAAAADAETANATEATPAKGSLSETAMAQIMQKFQAMLAVKSLQKPEYDVNDKFDTPRLDYVGDAPPIVPGNAKAALDLPGRDNAKMAVFLHEIIVNSTGNPYVTDATWVPRLTLATDDLTDAITVHQAALEWAKSLNQTVMQKRAAADAVARDFQGYVQGISQGDAAVILSTGLPLAKGRRPSTVLMPPTGVIMERGTLPNSMVVRWNRMANARGYLVQLAEEGPTLNWVQQNLCTRSRLTLSNLTVGKTYYVRVSAAGGRDGQSQWSQPVMLICA